jgi:hypothetical protein
MGLGHMHNDRSQTRMTFAQTERNRPEEGAIVASIKISDVRLVRLLYRLELMTDIHLAALRRLLCKRTS